MPGTDNRGFLTEERDKDLEHVSKRHHCPFLFFLFSLEFLSRHFVAKTQKLPGLTKIWYEYIYF